jgi:predicted Fe-S protein YdhL (DUF1289 family)
LQQVGEQLYCYTTGSLPSEFNTQFTDYSAIINNGWTSQIEANGDDEFASAGPALQQYNLPGQHDSSWKKIIWTQSKDVTISGKPYQASNGEFGNIYSPSKGVIMAVSNTSPSKVDDPPPETVPLERCSDVVWLTWANLCVSNTQQLQGIKYIFQINIINGDTNNMIVTFQSGGLDKMNGYNDKFSLYPGDSTSESILGTPDGKGIAWFLAQHKAQLGATRTITEIVVWNSVDNDDERDILGKIPCMLFILIDPGQSAGKLKAREIGSSILSGEEGLPLSHPGEQSVDVKHVARQGTPGTPGSSGSPGLPGSTGSGTSEELPPNPNLVLARGHQLYCWCTGTLPATEVTPWTSFRSINDNGWSLVPQGNGPPLNNVEYQVLQGALQLFNLPGQYSNTYQKITYSQNRQVQINGVAYPPTDGEFTNIYNPQYGIILAVDNHSPKTQEGASEASRYFPFPVSNMEFLLIICFKQNVVPLNQWSDVVYLIWMNVCANYADRAQQLQYVAQANVLNRATNYILDMVMPSGLKANLGWQNRATFYPGSNEFLVHITFAATLGILN